MPGEIHRRKKSKDFVPLDTHCVRNPKLKWDAKGLHTYLMQLPSDWKINLTDLENRSANGREGTASPMNALIAECYVLRERKHDVKGKFEGFDYYVFERPEHAQEWLTMNGKTVNGKTVNGLPADGSTVNGKAASNKYEGNNLTDYSTKNEEREDEDLPLQELNTDVTPHIPDEPPQEPEIPKVIRIDHRPNVETATALLKCLSAFYKQYYMEWKDGILQLGKGAKYTEEEQVEIVKDFCCWAISKNMGNDTYKMLNASLQSWFRNEQFVTWKKSNKPENKNGEAGKYVAPRSVFKSS